MTRADQLSELLVAWHEEASEQLEELRESMAISDHATRLRKLSAAATGLESLRAELEARLRNESSVRIDHGKTTLQYIDKTLTQCKKLRPHSRDLVVAVSQIMGPRDKATPDRRPYTELQKQRKDIVLMADCVEEKLQELLDSVNELATLLRGNGDTTDTSHSRVS